MSFSLAQLEAAARTVYAALPPTPQYASPLLAARAGCEVWVKHENHTPTGAFKVRGGLVFFDRHRNSAGGEREAMQGRKAGLVLSGGNVELELFLRVLG